MRPRVKVRAGSRLSWVRSSGLHALPTGRSNVQEKPAVAPIFVAQAILELVAGRGLIDVALQGSQRCRQILGVNMLAPGFIAVGKLSIAEAKHLLAAWGEVDFIGDEVPVP